MAKGAQLRGVPRLKRKLDLLPLALRREVAGLMQEGAETVAEDVRRQIASEPKSGRWYIRRNIRYRASAPGEAPALATGALFGTIRIKTSTRGDKPKARLLADGVYRLLERGTRLMRARPAFVPALRRNAKAIIERVEGKSRDVFRRLARK